MEEIKLDVQLRNNAGSKESKALRRNQLIPAIIYGGKQKPTSVQVDRKAFERISRLHRGENVIFHLNVVDGTKKISDYTAMTKEVQLHPVHDDILHIDFNRISLTEKIEVKVVIEAEGEPIGVKKDGGSLEHVMWELDVVCLPTQIPQSIKVDVSHLKIHDSIHVRDLKLPSGVTTEHDADSIVLTVVASMKEEVAPVEAAAAPELEVIKEKKKEPEAAAGAKKEEAPKEAKKEGK